MNLRQHKRARVMQVRISLIALEIKRIARQRAQLNEQMVVLPWRMAEPYEGESIVIEISPNVITGSCR